MRGLGYVDELETPLCPTLLFCAITIEVLDHHVNSSYKDMDVIFVSLCFFDIDSYVFHSLFHLF